MILAIALVLSVGIVVAVLIGGEWYQKILFDEYMEDISDPPRKSLETNPNLPSIDILP